MQTIYLDYNATTPVDPQVLAAILPFFSQHFGNPSSTLHPFGWAAAEAVQKAREQLAALIEAAPEELVFTSGATEALNLAIRGVAAAYATKGKHFITVKTEHKAVLETFQALESQGFSTTFLEVDEAGLVSIEALQAALRPDTILVAIMWANNETGVCQDIPALYEAAKAQGALFLTDATQALGKIPVSVAHADLLVGSAHKLYGPKGAGFLYLRRRNPRVRLIPMNTGGGQERGLRGGTLHVTGIVGLGQAAALAQEFLMAEAKRLTALRDRMEATLQVALPQTVVQGVTARRLPNTSNLRIAGLKASHLVKNLHEVALSTGSACGTASPKPSHVLTAMGLDSEAAFETLRISLGRMTTEAELDFATQRLIEVAKTLLPG